MAKIFDLTSPHQKTRDDLKESDEALALIRDPNTNSAASAFLKKMDDMDREFAEAVKSQGWDRAVFNLNNKILWEKMNKKESK